MTKGSPQLAIVCVSFKYPRMNIYIYLFKCKFVPIGHCSHSVLLFLVNETETWKGFIRVWRILRVFRSAFPHLILNIERNDMILLKSGLVYEPSMYSLLNTVEILGISIREQSIWLILCPSALQKINPRNCFPRYNEHRIFHLQESRECSPISLFFSCYPDDYK